MLTISSLQSRSSAGKPWNELATLAGQSRMPRANSIWLLRDWVSGLSKLAKPSPKFSDCIPMNCRLSKKPFARRFSLQRGAANTPARSPSASADDLSSPASHRSANLSASDACSHEDPAASRAPRMGTVDAPVQRVSVADLFESVRWLVGLLPVLLGAYVVGFNWATIPWNLRKARADLEGHVSAVPLAGPLPGDDRSRFAVSAVQPAHGLGVAGRLAN